MSKKIKCEITKGDYLEVDTLSGYVNIHAESKSQGEWVAVTLSKKKAKKLIKEIEPIKNKYLISLNILAVFI